jgi:hypothetical protein
VWPCQGRGEWGDPAIVRDRLGDTVKDLVFNRAGLLVPALSPAHLRVMVERSAGPVMKLVEALEVDDPVGLEKFRREYERLATDYFEAIGHIYRTTGGLYRAKSSGLC